MRYLVSMSLALWLGVLPNRSWASGPRGQILGESPTCIVDQGVAAFDVPVHEDVMTAFHFPADIKREIRPRHWRRHFKVKQQNDTLLVAPLPNQRDAALTVLVLTDNPDWKISLFLHATDSPDKALKACRFVARDVVEAEQQRINAEVQRRTAGFLADFEETQKKEKRAQQLAMARQRLIVESKVDAELVPMVRQMSSTSGDVVVRLGRAMWLEGEFWTSFVIDNSRGWRPFRLSNVQIANRNGTILPLRDVALDLPAVPDDQEIAEIPAGHRVEGVMRLPDIARGVEPQAVSFSGFMGAHMIVTTAEEPIWVWVPRREDELKEEERRKAQERAEQGVVSVHLQGIYGAIWLDDGAGLGESDATSLKGLGVLATYSFNRYIAFEGEALGASTGHAQFKNVSLDGSQGNLERSAALGRVQLGGVLRLGSGRWVPLARLGVGLQGASHSGSLLTETGEAPGPESFEWNTLFIFGTGLDVRLGGFVAGVALSVVSPWGDYEAFRRSIEAGFHLGYRWNP